MNEDYVTPRERLALRHQASDPWVVDPWRVIGLVVIVLLLAAGFFRG